MIANVLERIEGLPAPVRQYFRFALMPGQRIVKSARIEQRGEFALQAGKWIPFTATETFVASPPSFVWNADMAMLPLIPTHVCDSFVDGEGGLVAKIAGLVAIVNERGTKEMNAGELQRYLAECAYLPTALLPGNGLGWAPIDADSAQATLTCGNTKVSLDFRFAEDGAMLECTGERYFREADGTSTLRPWHGRWSAYTRIDGMMIPGAGEVAWLLPSGLFPYWRGRTIGAAYEYYP